jgi:predicted RNase H-like HicB family nuclease
VSESLKAIVFETDEGQWVGAVPVYPYVTLSALSHKELVRLLDQAKRRGL